MDDEDIGYNIDNAAIEGDLFPKHVDSIISKQKRNKKRNTNATTVASSIRTRNNSTISVSK